MAVLLSAVSAEAAPAAPDGGAGKAIDLDLHGPPRGPTAAGPPPGAQLTPPRSSQTTKYGLRPLAGGGYFYRGTAFDARIANDGTVAFTDHRVGLAREPESRSAASDRDPLTNGDPLKGAEPLTVGGGPAVRFDLTDQYLHLRRKDPARDAKADFLSSTFDLRMKLALEARHELREAALRELPARLDALWADPRLTPAERVYLLRALRDDVGERSDGAAARAVLRDFAKRHLSKPEAAAYR